MREPRAVQIAGQAEVADLHAAVLGQKQVGRLQVAVDHADLMGVFQCGANLHRTLDRLAPRQPAPLPQHVLERAAVDQLHGEVDAVVGQAAVVVADDVRMVELLDDGHFADEAALQVRLGGRVGLQELDDGGLARLAVPRAIHVAHRARRQQLAQFIIADRLLFHRRRPAEVSARAQCNAATRR